MKNLVKKLYQVKIVMMFYFNLGYGEVAGLTNLVKDSAIILGFFSIVLHDKMTLTEAVSIYLVAFITLMVGGIILKRTHMADFASRTNNSINPQVMTIEDELEKKLDIIIKHLGI